MEQGKIVGDFWGFGTSDFDQKIRTLPKKKEIVATRLPTNCIGHAQGGNFPFARGTEWGFT